MSIQSGRMEKFFDLDRSPGCSVIYAQPHRVTEWRPAFKNLQNPYQHDKTYLNRLDISRQRVQEQHATMKVKSMEDKMRSTWSGGETADRPDSAVQLNDAILGMVPEIEVPALGRSGRSFSTPTLGSKPFFQLRGLPHSPHDSVHRARLAAAQTAHMPGYRGFVPGFASETHSVAHRFATATQRTLEQRHSDRTGFLEGLQRKTWGVTPFNA